MVIQMSAISVDQDMCFLHRTTSMLAAPLKEENKPMTARDHTLMAFNFDHTLAETSSATNLQGCSSDFSGELMVSITVIT